MRHLSIVKVNMEIVIIGNSAAAVGAIEAVRRVDRAIPITVISDESHPVYSRPLISHFLAGELKSEQIFYRPKNFYEKNNVQTLLGRHVVKVNFDKKTVKLENGEKVSYRQLLIATGGTPFIPKIEGLDKTGIYTFTKLDDTKKISSVLKENQRAVVIGGGFIGLKAGEALKKRKIDVTIVELADYILSLTLDETAAFILEKALKREGIHLITSNTVEAILGDSMVESVLLADGRIIEAQLVVIAIGVIPNVAPFRESPLYIEKGILVNERMETNLPDVYAAGDVTQAYDKILKTYRTIPIWPNAYQQGKIAGYQMAGNKKYVYEGGFMMNSIEIGNVPAIAIGLTNLPPNNGYQVIKKFDRASNVYRKVILKGDVIVGAIFSGQIDRAGILTGLLRDGVEVKGFKRELVKDHFGFISFPKTLRKERMLNFK
jgi:NAD(P)H-nitrite reductase large subunit